MKKIISLLIIISIIAAVVVWKEQGAASKSTRAAKVVPVSVVHAQIQSFDLKTSALGTLFARESVEITANVTEKIAKIHFNDGQRVSRGDILITLEQDEEQALLAQAKTNVAEQQRETQHLEKLLKKQSISQNLVDAQRTKLIAAKQHIEEVNASIKDRTLRAPFDGVLGLRRVSLGALVTPGTVIVTLDDVTTMKLDFSVPAIYLSTLQENMPIVVRAAVLEGEQFNGRVLTIDSRVDPLSRSIQVRAQLPNSNGRLKPGLLMDVELIKDKQQSVVLPEVSVVSLQDRHFVLVVSEDENNELRVNRRYVQIGAREYGSVQILKGVEPNERVVVEGVGLARPGGRVTIKSAPESTQAEAE